MLNDSEFDEDEEAKRARGLPDLEQEPIPHEDDARGPADTGLSSLFHELPGPVHDEPVGAPLAPDEGVVAEASGLQHFRHGLASDDKIYRNDHGERVKLDKRRKPYRVDADGIRKLPTNRPEGMRPEAWQQIQPMLKRKGITYDEYVRQSKEADARLSLIHI